MSYEISPDPAFWPFALDNTVALRPDPMFWPFLQGIPVESKVCPPPLFWPVFAGAPLPLTVQVPTLGVAGTTTYDDVWPDDSRPQHRLNQSFPPNAITYEVQYHGCPGVSSGDDNWSSTDPSYQPQLRLNTIPHTAPVQPRWQINPVFLAPPPV